MSIPRKFSSFQPVLFVLLVLCGQRVGTAYAAVPAGAPVLHARLDATQVARGRVTSHLAFAVQPGPLTLVVPKWIPGEHSPSGPIDLMIGLEIRTAQGQVLRWQRDPLNLFAFRLEVPAGTSGLEVTLEAGLPTPGGDFLTRRRSTPQLAVVSWHPMLLFPASWPDSTQVAVQAEVTGPAGWQQRGGLAAGSLAALIDSPVQFGRNAARRDVKAGEVTHALSVVADTPEALDTNGLDYLATHLARLAEEGESAFGSRPFGSYEWLLSLSDEVGAYGLEHANGSDNGMYLGSLGSDDGLKSTGALLAHEYVHAWNGKFRRPRGLYSPTYQEPMDGTLLWVYEGMTQFWGDVLATRAGFQSPDEYRELLAYYAAEYQAQPGANWRSLEDTATAVAPGYDFPEAWSSRRRGVEFYDASTFLWLAVDLELRANTKQRVGLDDFAKVFFRKDKESVSLYSPADVCAALAKTAPGTTAADWERFMEPQLKGLSVQPMMTTLERAGWRLKWTAEPNWWVGVRESEGHFLDRRWSLGLTVGSEATVGDVVGNGPAELAGVTPGARILGVNGRLFSTEALDAGIAAAAKSGRVEMLLEDSGFYRTAVIAYAGGARFPHLERIESVPDRLVSLVGSRRSKDQ